MHVYIHSDTHLSQMHKYILGPWVCTATQTFADTCVYRHTRLPACSQGALAGRCTPTPARTLQHSSGAPSPGRAPTPTHSSPWTTASGLDQGQGVGAGHAEAEDGGWSRHQAGERRLDDLGCLGRRAWCGVALPPPWHEELINLMN